MWKHIDYNGFEIHISPLPKCGSSPEEKKFSYIGYICRPGANISLAEEQTRFSQRLATFASKDEAIAAAYIVGKSLVDARYRKHSFGVL